MDRLIADGARHFLKTLQQHSKTTAIIVTVQPDGYTQFHTSITDSNDVTQHLMRLAAGDREGATVQ